MTFATAPKNFMRWRIAAAITTVLVMTACHSATEAPAAKPTPAPTPAALQTPVPFDGKLLTAARPGQREPDRKQFAALAGLADRACRCAHRTKDEQAMAQCWSEFDSNAATYPSYSESTTMCMIAETKLCFGRAGCLTKEYGSYCSKAEYEAVARGSEGCQ